MTPRLKVLSVGGNPVSAFLSWRLQATNACDVTLVWKTGFEHVSQYGISFQSQVFGNERFKPRHVVRSPEDAVPLLKEGPFDYVILCIKALPDVYDMAAVIDSVVAPQHTCILINTTHSLGVESALEERFPTNVVLSLVSGAEVVQLAQSEFEHRGSCDLWVGPSTKKRDAEGRPAPSGIEEDMAHALTLTLQSGHVNCQVTSNIRQHQFERVIGNIAFHPLTVLFETPNYAALMEKVGVRQLVNDIMDELLMLADAQGCKFPDDYKQKTIDEYVRTTGDNIMWQDYVARRPMEVETYLGSPIRLAQEMPGGVRLPRIETLYALLHNANANRDRPKPSMASHSSGSSPPNSSPAPRAPGPAPRSVSNNLPPPRQRPRNQSSMSSIGPPNGMRRPPPGGPPNGYGRPPMNGMPNGRQPSRRGSLEGNDLEEFSHLVVYDEIPEAGESNFAPPNGAHDLALREREVQLRQRELALREQEMRMRRGGPGGPGGPLPRRGPPMPPPSRNGHGMYDDEDEDDDFFDPTSTPGTSMIDPDNFDMMSMTSRKNRKAPSNPNAASQFRKNPEYEAMPPSRGGGSRFRPNFGRNRSSQHMMNSVPGVRDNIMDDPLLGFTSNRYGAVDRGTMQAGSRANSLTAARLDELQYSQGPPMMNGANGMNGAMPRRSSQYPGQPYSPSIRGGGNGNGRPSPPHGYANGNGRPSPPNGVQQPVPRYPPGHGNAVAPQQVEQRAGVSSLQPPTPNKGKNVPSLTGSASASAGSGDSTNLDLSEPSAHSSQSSLGPRPPIGVR